MSLKKGNIKRMIAVICTFIVVSTFAIMPAFATEEPCDFGQLYCIINADTLNVRASASVDAEILATLPIGTYSKVNWVEPGWVNIAYNGDGLMGFVSDEFVTVHMGPIPEFDNAGGRGVIEIAKQYLGVPYVYGGTSPNGFDCSGFVKYVYKQLGYDLYRVAADQMKNGVAISKENLAPGDLIGFYSSPGGGYIGHIGIYVGEDMMIHAPRTGDVVKFTSIADDTYHGKRFAGARRIIY